MKEKNECGYDIFGGKICLIGHLSTDIVLIMLCHLPANKGPPQVVCRCYTETTSSPPASYWRSGGRTK